MVQSATGKHESDNYCGRQDVSYCPPLPGSAGTRFARRGSPHPGVPSDRGGTVGRHPATLPGLTDQLTALTGQLMTVQQPLMDQFETMWNSRSWHALRPIRNFFRRCRRLPPERKPTIDSLFDAQQAIKSIKRSLTWNATRPFRVVRKMTFGS